MKNFDAAFDRITSHGWLTRDEALLLVKYAEMTSGPIVEVGSYYGRSAMVLASLGRYLYCIDPWDNKFDDKVSGPVYVAIHDFTNKDVRRAAVKMLGHPLETAEKMAVWKV